MTKYTYFLDFGSGNTEFFPDKDAVYSWKEDSNSEGFMRRKIGETLISKDYDNNGVLSNTTIFNTLWEWYFDLTKHKEEIKLQIFKDSVLDYESIFYVIDGSIDINTGTYVIKPETDDDYKTLLLFIDDEVDIIQDSGSHEVDYSYTSLTEDSGVIGTDPAPDASGTWVVRTAYPPYNWVRQQSQYNIDDVAYTTGIKLTGDPHWYYAEESATNKHFIYPNCFYLVDAIQFILDSIIPASSDIFGMQFESHFFNDSTNYVTGEPNNLMYSALEQKSDTKDPTATAVATIGKVSLSDLMNDLLAIFDVYWYIDDSGNFRVEHRKWFYSGLSVSGNKTVGIDLTESYKYSDPSSGKLYIEDTQQFEGQTESSENVKKQTIKFLDEDSEDFRSDRNYIEYDVIKYLTAIKEYSVGVISTDVKKAINNPDDVGDDGFFLFNCNSFDVLQTEPYYFNDTSYKIGNAGFSTRWLLYRYYRYGRQDSEGVLESSGSFHPGEQFSIVATAPIFIQKELVFLLNDSDSIDVNRYIATILIKSDGTQETINGDIISIEQDLHDDFITATLGFEL